MKLIIKIKYIMYFNDPVMKITLISLIKQLNHLWHRFRLYFRVMTRRVTEDDLIIIGDKFFNNFIEEVKANDYFQDEPIDILGIRRGILYMKRGRDTITLLGRPESEGQRVVFSTTLFVPDPGAFSGHRPISQPGLAFYCISDCRGGFVYDTESERRLHVQDLAYEYCINLVQAIVLGPDQYFAIQGIIIPPVRPNKDPEP